MAILTKHFLISGRVQGVGFRAFTYREAVGRKLKGWVRNLVDGRVETLVMGEESLVNEFEGRIRRGPQWSEVKDFRSALLTKAVDLSEFKIESDGMTPCFENV